MWHNIPAELQAIPQWVCARLDKVPVDPKTGITASVTNTATWGTFQQAVNAGLQHIGFVLSDSDPYTIIDLDEPQTEVQAQRHTRILQAFASYAEVSQSGKGAHVIVRGRVPNGARRDRIEVYSTARYMICTGNVLYPLPIVDRQHLLDQLYAEIAGQSQVVSTSAPQMMSDDDVWRMGMQAENGEKFVALCRGEWQGVYPSQSEADLALLSMLCFYTRNDEQVARMFRQTALGQRDKAQRNDKYLGRTIARIRSREPAPVDVTALVQQAQSVAQSAGDDEDEDDEDDEDESAYPVTQSTLTLPPGLAGELAQYITESAIRPVQDIGIMAALSLLSGIAGRAYNISGTGLNQYLILLARTGTGKEGAVRGINALLGALRASIPMVDSFIGPGAFASGQALVRMLDDKPCFVSILGEFGLTLQQLCDPRAPAPMVLLRKVLLDIYSKSGKADLLSATAYSDRERNTTIVRSPSVTLFGESTPELFYGGLNIGHIAEGLIPRFSIIEYNGRRVPRNFNAFFAPPDGMVQRLASIAEQSIRLQQQQQCIDISVEPDALALLDAFDVQADNHINSATNEVTLQLWNRAHLKAIKLAGVLSVGINPYNPIVTVEAAQWAIDFVTKDVTGVESRFVTGDFGTGVNKQYAEVQRIIADYVSTKRGAAFKGYRITRNMHKDCVIPYDYLRRRVLRVNAFTHDRRGVANVLKGVIEDMIQGDMLIRLPPEQAYNKYNTRGTVYYVARVD